MWFENQFFGITKNWYTEAQDLKDIPEEKLKKIDLRTGCIKHDFTEKTKEKLSGYKAKSGKKLLIDEVNNIGQEDTALY